MLKRAFIIVILAAVPASARAEATQTINPPPDSQNQSLGPSTTNSPGADTGTSQILQPSSSTTAQALQGADAIGGGIPLPTSSNDLQSAGGQTQFKDFAGLEADSAPRHSPSQAPTTRNWVWLIALLGLAGLIWLKLNASRLTPTTTDDKNQT